MRLVTRTGSLVMKACQTRGISAQRCQAGNCPLSLQYSPRPPGLQALCWALGMNPVLFALKVLCRELNRQETEWSPSESTRCLSTEGSGKPQVKLVLN